MAKKSKGVKKVAVGKPRRDRVNVDVFCELGIPPRRGLGRIRDFNQNGCMVHTPRQMRVTETLQLSIQLPGFSQEFKFKVEVRWIKVAGTPKRHYSGKPTLGRGEANLYHVGVKFLHTPSTYKVLKSLLWELQSGHIPEMERKKERSTRRRKR